MFSLRFGGGFNWGLPRWARQQQQRNARRRAASSSAGAAGGESYSQRVSGWQGPAKAGLISGSLSGLGDVLAQAVAAKEAQSRGGAPAAYDPVRTLRMLGFGALWYGPYQHYWYNLLDWAMPLKGTQNFITKVVLNQAALAPVVLAFVFSWNLALTGQAGEIGGKIRRDLVPTMINGWKFWVPAASINFYFVPLNKQVLYMSCCGLLWTAYLSHASANKVGRDPPAPLAMKALPPAKGAKAKPCCAKAAKGAKGKEEEAKPARRKWFYFF